MTGAQEPDAGYLLLRDRALLKEQILWQQVRQLYSLAPIGLIATLTNSVIVFFVMRNDMPAATINAWLAAVLAISALRLGLVLRFRQLQPGQAAASTWERWYLGSLLLVGLAWGSIGFLPFSFSIAHQVFLAFVLGGMAAGASSTFSKVPYGYAAFAIPAMLPLALHFFLINDDFHRAMAAMILLYIVLLSRVSRHNYQVNRSSLLLRFENQEMIENLKRAKEAVEGLNAQLVAGNDAKLKAEAELRVQQEHLERTVAERTADLVRANEQLKTEIDDRKRIEKALRESRERLVLAQKAGRVGVFDWDMTANRLIWTAEMEQLFGLKPGEFKREYREWARRVHPDDLADFEAKLSRWKADRVRQVEFEYRFLRASGETRWMAGNARIGYNESGAPQRMIGTNLDVTEMKEAQGKLTAAKNAAEAGSRAKGEFLANMSHEMRTPLAGVLGMIKLVLDMKIGAEERELLEMAKRSADSLLRLIADVLDFSRQEAGMMKFERKPYSISDVIRSAVEVVSPSVRERRLQLLWQVDPGLPEQVEGDAGRVRQVLVNLLGNAVKFTEAGAVEVTARPFQAPESGRRGFILFSVKDTGVGIAADQLDKIFGKFTQIDSSLTRKFGGTGLGLALSRQIVENMGGRLWAESSVGVGSTFHFTLPRHP